MPARSVAVMPVETASPQSAVDFRASIRRGWSRPRAWLVTALIVAALELLCFWAQGYDRRLARENGPMENFQAMCLLLGAMLLGGSALRHSGRGWRIFLAALSLFYATFLVLEVDFRGWGIGWLSFIFNGWFRNLWLGVSWLVAGLVAWRHFSVTLGAFRGWFVTFPAAVLLVSGCCWVQAGLVDKSLFGRKTLFKEELFEVAGAWLMVQSAAQTARGARPNGARGG